MTNAPIIRLIVFLIFPLFTETLFAWPVPDTGQTACYDQYGNVIACPEINQAYYGQDASYSINPPSFTKLDENGNVLSDDATIWSMVRDNVTGLIWEVKNNKDGIKDYTNPRDTDNIYTWYDSDTETNGGASGTDRSGTDTEDFITALNAINFGGHSDWRMPTLKELRSIVNYGPNSPKIETAYFPNTWQSFYWSSNTFIIVSDYAFQMGFMYGHENYTHKDLEAAVRAVRGGHSSPVLIDNGDGTVTDRSTGLMWQQATASGLKNWTEAISYCEGLDLSGYIDWRLPTIKELGSIADLQRSNPSIDTTFFPDTQTSSPYWSSTTYANPSYTDDAFAKEFGGGLSVGFGRDKSYLYYVRGVRGGTKHPKAPPFIPLLLLGD